MIKKIFNKVLFASVFALVFALINLCEVKAYGYFQNTSNITTNGTIINHSDYNELFVDVSYGGSAFQYGCENDTPYWNQVSVNTINYVGSVNLPRQCSYVLQNKNNPYSFAWGFNKTSDSGSESGLKPTSMFMYHVFANNNTYNFAIIQSYGSAANTTSNYMIYYEGTPPILTNLDNTENGTYRLTATSKTYVLHYRQGFNYVEDMGYNWSNYPWIYYFELELDSNEYVDLTGNNTKAPFKDLYWYGSTDINNRYSYFATEPIAWNTRDNNQNDFPYDDLQPPVEYKIEYSAINSTNNSQEIFGNDNTITGGGIAIKYSPLNNELYNYYYYWEKDEGQEPIGNPNDINDWEQLDSSDKGIGVVVVDSNGWLYAKITDKNGNMLANNVLNYKAYGKTSLFPASYVKTDTWLGKFADQINYGGPINSIITVPINLLNTLFQSFGGTCQSFNMGAILGKNITFNCFTLESILGSSITNVIDMLCSFFIYYHLVLFIISIYRKIMNLDDLDDYLPQHLYHPKHGDYNDYNF